MNDKDSCSITSFDSTFTTNHIQMLKILLPYLEPQLQKAFSIYIKLMEFHYTISYFQNHAFAFPTQNPPDAEDAALWDAFLPLCDAEEKTKIESVRTMLQQMQKMQEMMETLQLMQEIFPEGMGNMDDLSQMDLSSMMEMFGKLPT